MLELYFLLQLLCCFSTPVKQRRGLLVQCGVIYTIKLLQVSLFDLILGVALLMRLKELFCLEDRQILDGKLAP